MHPVFGVEPLVQAVHGGPRVWPSGYPDQYSTHSPFGPRETLGSCVKIGNIEREAFVLLARLKTPSADATACTTKLLTFQLAMPQ